MSAGGWGLPHRLSVAEISQALGIHAITLDKWRQVWRLQEVMVPASQKDPEDWGPADKFTVLLQSAGLNVLALGGYCRQRSLFSRQVERWRQASRMPMPIRCCGGLPPPAGAGAVTGPVPSRHPLGVPGGLRREQITRIRRRHRGYRMLLSTICLVLLLQPLAQHWLLLNSLASIVLALVMMLFLTRYSPLQARRKYFYGLGIAAIASELLWMLGLAIWPSLAIHLASVHLVIWSLFISAFMLRKVMALMLEPYVTQAVVMGAAAGYLLIGYLGAFLLHTLLLWHPAAFDLSQLPAGIDPVLMPQRAFPSMVVASFGALTTTGPDIARPGEVLASTGCLAITIVGQLYVAVLIALILGRFHRRPSD